MAFLNFPSTFLCIFFIYIFSYIEKSLKICHLNIINKIRKDYKKSSWMISKSLLKRKRKKQQYSCERYKNILEDKSLLSIKKNITEWEKKNYNVFIHIPVIFFDSVYRKGRDCYTKVFLEKFIHNLFCKNKKIWFIYTLYIHIYIYIYIYMFIVMFIFSV